MENKVFSNLSFLSDEEIGLMSSNLSERIDDHLGQIVEERASLQGRCEKHNVELEEANLQLQSLQDRVRVLESNESKLAQDNAELRTSTAELQKAKLQADTDLHNTETNRQLLASTVDKKDQQLTELRDEVARLSAKSERLTTELTEAQVKKVDEESSYSVIRGQLSRKENECLQLIEERNTLDSEKMAFMRQINRLQLEKSSQASNFHHNTETLKNDLSNTQQLLETYKQQSESVTERLRLEQTRHRECRDNFISAEESHRQELASQKKLAAMYKEAEQKATSELQDLHKTAADYKECFEQLTKEHEEVMAQMKSQVEELSGVVTAKDEHISQIEAELARMNELMKESSESPDVTAELARLIKSGLTYSQLYHKYHQTAEQLAVEKGESSRLNDCLDTLVKEIDVMRPQVTQLRNAYEAASSMVQKLSEQLKANLQNLDDEARKAGESQKMAIHYQKETNKYRVENEDLALQVQVLTKEIHVAKGGRVVDEDISTQVSSSSSSQSTAADVISNQLVSFKDIQELQKQNQQLRLALRSLSEAQEASDKSGEGSEKSKALEMELANTRQEVGFLKQSRLKQEELVQSIIKQRDMYKRLVEQGDVKEAQARASPLRSTTEVDSEKLRSLKEELKTSKDSLEKVNREFQAYRKEQRDEERKLSNELEEVKKERTEIKLNNAKLTTQLDYSMESSKVIEKNVVAYKQEISALRTKAEQYSNLVAKNESLVENLRADLSRAQESSVKFDVANQQAKNEVEMLKAVNRRLQVEADTAKKDYNLQLQMLSNLQSIQTSIESSNVEMKAHYQHRLEQSLSDNQALEKQIVSLKEDMKTVESHQAAEVTSWKEKVESLNQQLASSQEKLLKAIDEQKHHRQTSAARVGGDDSDAAAAQSGDSQDLRHAKSEIEALKDQLRLSGEASDEYRVAADRLELTLRELTAVSQQTQETLERKVAQQQAEMEEQAGKLKVLTQQYDTVFEQKNNLESELAHTKSQLSSKVAELEATLNSYKQRLESKELVEAQARVDLQQSSHLNDELSSKYQAELQNSVKLSEECSSLKKEKDTLANKILSLENDAIRLELQLQSNHASYEEREKGHKENIESVTEQLKHSKEQTTLLHQQLEYLSVKQNSEGASQNTDESDQQSILKLLELVKVLRKDKELYETKLESSTAECKRLESKITFVESELKRARDELAGERSQASIDVQTKAQHAELLRKVEQINVLTDSNRMLRQEKDSMQPEINQLQLQVSQLSTDIVPLEGKITELNMSLQTLEAEKIALQNVSDHWKQRSDSLVQKFDQEKMEENKRHSAEMELQKKLTVNLSQQVQKLTAELNKVKSTVTATEAEKAKLAENVAELEKKVATLEATLESNKEDISKKEGLINELKKLGRNYRLKYNKLLEAQGSGSGTGSGTGAASAGEDSTSGAPPTSQASNEAVSKLQTELSALKDTLASKEAEITRLTSEIEASQKAKDDLASLKNEFSELTEKHNKVKADFEELNSKNTALKDFVNVSLKPKLAAQKKDLEKKSEETKQLKDKAAELENQLEEAQQNLDESRAKLLSLEEKSASSQSSNQSGHITASTDSKRSQVRTIEVRPMAQQQPKQPTATVMPTTSQAESQEANVEEVVVGIVSPTSVAASPNTNVASSNSASAEVPPVQQLSSLPSSTSTSGTSVTLPSGAASSSSSSVIFSLHSTVPQQTASPVVSLNVAPQAAPATIITSHVPADNTSMFGSNSVVGLVASSSTNIDAAGTSGVGSVPDAGQSSEAEANKAKRSRAEFEADDNMTAPSTKRQREGENESLPEVDDGTSQDVDTEDDQFSQEDDFASAVSSMQPEGPGHNEASPNVEREPLSETALPVTSDLQQHVVAAEQSQLTMASRAIRQEPTYSGVNADVVIILSSDDEDEAMGQVQTTQHTGEYYSEGESENAEEDVVDEEYGDIEEVEEGMSSSEEVGEEEEPAGESDYDDAEEGDEVADTSDIIVQEELSNHTSHLGMSVSSSQPGTSEGESRRMATLAALNYQAQGTVSVDSNLTEGDGIVPSTPTLAVPISRNDGFAVAVSSPNPSLAPFTFGSSLLPSSEHADLAQQAIIMDDLPRFGDSEAGPMSVDNEVEEPMATTSSQEQSNEVSTESHFELASSTHSPAAAAASTSGVTASEEPVSSSEANNTSTRSVREPIVWQDNSQSSQSDMPSSSSQSRPPVARRGRIRGARLNRPTFNKPQ